LSNTRGATSTELTSIQGSTSSLSTGRIGNNTSKDCDKLSANEDELEAAMRSIHQDEHLDEQISGIRNSSNNSNISNVSSSDSSNNTRHTSMSDISRQRMGAVSGHDSVIDLNQHQEPHALRVSGNNNNRDKSSTCNNSSAINESTNKSKRKRTHTLNSDIEASAISNRQKLQGVIPGQESTEISSTYTEVSGARSEGCSNITANRKHLESVMAQTVQVVNTGSNSNRKQNSIPSHESTELSEKGDPFAKALSTGSSNVTSNEAQFVGNDSEIVPTITRQQQTNVTRTNVVSGPESEVTQFVRPESIEILNNDDDRTAFAGLISSSSSNSNNSSTTNNIRSNVGIRKSSISTNNKSSSSTSNSSSNVMNNSTNTGSANTNTVTNANSRSHSSSSTSSSVELGQFIKDEPTVSSDCSKELNISTRLDASGVGSERAIGGDALASRTTGGRGMLKARDFSRKFACSPNLMERNLMGK
jgi:hypothetical protein